MRGLLGRLERRGHAGARADLGERRSQRGEQVLFGLDHGPILRLAPRAAGARAVDTTGCNPAGRRFAGMAGFAAPDRVQPSGPRRGIMRTLPAADHALELHHHHRTPAPTTRRRCRRRSASTACCASSAKARPARSSCATTTSTTATWRSSACAPAPWPTPHGRPLLRALLRRRGRAGGPPAAPERGADLRRRGRPERALPGDGVRGRQHAAAATAAPTSCCRWS